MYMLKKETQQIGVSPRCYHNQTNSFRDSENMAIVRTWQQAPKNSTGAVTESLHLIHRLLAERDCWCWAFKPQSPSPLTHFFQ